MFPKSTKLYSISGVLKADRQTLHLPIITPLMLLLFRKANDLQIVMETKGLGAPQKPTEIEALTTHSVNFFWLALILGVFILCTVLKFG